jgi:hypothetical protein
MGTVARNQVLDCWCHGWCHGGKDSLEFKSLSEPVRPANVKV